MSKVRVVAAMSGGVDSCVAAAMLLEQGYEVIGITMQLWNHGGDGDGRFDSCCSLTDVHDARLAAHALGIPHYVVNYEKEFRRGVVDYFAAEYAKGRTPNPCVMCNSKLKFDHLIERARALGADLVATGHYARVIHHNDGRPSELLRGLDERKDQSYFLFDMKPEYLQNVLFPLGGLTKPEVRRIAAGLGLHTAEKHESQEICFVSGRRYTDFLSEHYPEVTTLKGEIVDRAGNVLGHHDGIHMFTVGQRKGLGDSLGPVPKYVAAIDPASRRVIVDDLENIKTQAFHIENFNWIDKTASGDPGRVFQVMVRYRAQPRVCRLVHVEGSTYEVLLPEAIGWVTPGQAAVVFDGEKVIGGGFIASGDISGQRGVGRAVRGTPEHLQPHP